MFSPDLIGYESGSGSDSADSVTESQNSSQISVKQKRVDTSFKCWKFLETIQADVLACEFEERKRKLIEHFRTRTTHERLICVRSVTIFADLRPLVLALPNENPTVSIAIIGYVQTKPRRPYTMTTWDPVPGGLCSNGEFLADVDRSDDQSLTWFRLPIFGEVGLNNLGCITARDKRKVSFPSLSSIFIQCRLITVVFVCRGSRSR